MNPEQKSEKFDTLSDIAAKCGVTNMTVSHALKGDPQVSEKVRLKILEAAKKLGYQTKAKQGCPCRMEVKTWPCIDVLIGTSTSRQAWYYSSLLISLEQELGQHQYDCIVRSCDDSYNGFLRVCEILRTQLPQRLMVVGYFTAKQLDVIASIVPEVLLVDNTGHPAMKATCEIVGFDNIEAARIGVRHLLELGRKKILLLKGFEDHYFSREIEQGYIQALVEASLTLNRSYIIESDFTAEQARIAISECVEKGLDFDGVFTNDEMATGVLQALQALGKKVPLNVAVCGCDDLPICEQLIPSLTTVHLDHEELARVAVNHFFAEKTESSMLCKIKLAPRLKVRESTVMN